MLTAAAFISTTLSTTTSCSSSFQIINQGIANAETSIGPVDGLLTSSACCARCMSTPECIAWTWHVSPPHTCWLTAHPDVPHGAAGTVVSGIPKPAPTAPPTAAPTHILPQPALAPPLGYRPNVIFILTDDQDYMQHSMEAMPATRALFSDAQSFNMSRAYVATPICCPSRASYLTGMHTHNHGTLQNSGARGCSSAEFVATKEEKAYPAYLKTAGYTTGFFGKYLNTYGTANPGGLSHIPRGWDHWEGLKGNSKYYNYSVSINGVPEVHHDDYATDYYTDLLANRSSAWLNAHLQSATSAPALLVVHTPAPHRPATPAPQFANSFSNHTAPRTPSWNHVSSSGPSGGGKHKWLSTLPSMNATTIEYSDHVWRRRLRALQSVDELVTKIHGIVEAHGAMERTVWIYTSDHGYHSGQFGVTHCKMLPYEEDIRIPMFVRLPTPKPMEEMTAMRKTTTTTNTLIASPILNIDIAPTLLALVGYAPMTDAPQMDGESMLAKIGFPPSNSKTTTKTKQQQQQQLGALTMSRSFLVEYWPIPATGNDLQHIMKGEDGWCTDDDVKFDPCPAVGTIVDSVNNSWACMRTLTAMPNAAAAAAAAGRPAASVSTNAEPTWKVNDVYCRFFDGTYFTLEDRKRNISNFVEFYDVEKDPYQLNNAVAALSKERKAELDAKLTKLMNCAGVECRLA